MKVEDGLNEDTTEKEVEDGGMAGQVEWMKEEKEDLKNGRRKHRRQQEL